MKKILLLLISVLLCHEGGIKALSQEEQDILSELSFVAGSEEENSEQRVQVFIKEHYNNEDIGKIKDLINAEIIDLQKKIQRYKVATGITGFLVGFSLGSAQKFYSLSYTLRPTAFHLGGGRYEQDLKEVSDILAGNKKVLDATENAKETIGKLLIATTKEGHPSTRLLPGYSREEGKPYHQAWFDWETPYSHYRWLALGMVGFAGAALFAAVFKQKESCIFMQKRLRNLQFVLSVIDEMAQQEVPI